MRLGAKDGPLCRTKWKCAPVESPGGPRQHSHAALCAVLFIHRCQTLILHEGLSGALPVIF